MKLHKNFIFASALALASGPGLALTGCNDDDEKIPAYFKADNREFTLEYDGLTDKGEEPSLTLNTSGSWKVSEERRVDTPFKRIRHTRKPQDLRDCR